MHVLAVILIAMLAIVRKLIISILASVIQEICSLSPSPSWHWAGYTG
jgi:hypothetical protein